MGSIRVVGTVIFILAVLLGVGSLIASGSKMFRGGPFYGYFICHHRAHAAAQARLIKAMLTSKIGQAVYVDTDDLAELDGLLDMLKSRVGTFIAYSTRSTLSKPWCAAEVTVALMTTKCKVLAVQTPSFLPPDEEELCDLRQYLQLQACNVEHYGITTAHMTAAFKKLLTPSEVTTIDLPEAVSGTRRFDALVDLIGCPEKPKQDESQCEPKLSPERMAGTLMVSSDRHSDEATAVVYLLRMKLKSELEDLVPNGMCCLCDFAGSVDITLGGVASVRAVIVLLSSGTLSCPLQLAFSACALKAMGDSGSLDVIPVSIPGFVCPIEEFFATVLPDLFRTTTGVEFGFAEVADFVQASREFFWSSRVALSTYGSEQLLYHEVQDLLQRMRRGPRRTTISRASRVSTRGGRGRDSKDGVAIASADGSDDEARSVMV